MGNTTAITFIVLCLTNNVAIGLDIIEQSKEKQFVGTNDPGTFLTLEESKILAHQDKLVGNETYIFTHELILGLLLGIISAVWFYAFLTRKRPLF